MAIFGSPISQQSRPIVLALFSPGFVWAHVFWLRPEDVVYSYPTRATVIQTLGGAYCDDFGEGVADITLTGHTGWRGSMGVPGELQFYNLRSFLIGEFHEIRSRTAEAGLDPDTVELLLADTLNAALFRVYPLSFVLRRNRQRPLLYQYTIRFAGLDNLLSRIPGPSEILSGVLPALGNLVGTL